MNDNHLDELFAKAQQDEPYLDSQSFVESLHPALDAIDWPPLWLKTAILYLGVILGGAIAIFFYPAELFVSKLLHVILEATSHISLSSILILSLTVAVISITSWYFTAELD